MIDVRSYITEPELKGGEWVFYYRTEINKPWFVLKNKDKGALYYKYNAVFRKIFTAIQNKQRGR